MSFLLQVSARFLAQMILLVSVLVLLRGHHLPGGGFIGGLMAACAVALMILAFHWQPKQLRRVAPMLMALGMLALLLGASGALFFHHSLLTGIWWGGFGTPLVFDIGVYLVVLGAITWLVVRLEDEQEQETS